MSLTISFFLLTTLAAKLAKTAKVRTGCCIKAYLLHGLRRKYSSLWVLKTCDPGDLSKFYA